MLLAVPSFIFQVPVIEIIRFSGSKDLSVVASNTSFVHFPFAPRRPSRPFV
jgi:hypothetical protein